MLHEHLRLSDRVIRCACGLVIDRDHNAVINICRVGFTRSHTVEIPLAVEQNACSGLQVMSH